MLELFDNAFSPFARKVRMALTYKELDYRSIDGLALDRRDELLRFNPRGEVPVLVDGDVSVIGSADIVSYLDDLKPASPLLPSTLPERVLARRWHHVADTTLDAVVHDISLWHWPTHRRSDAPPDKLILDGMQDALSILREADSQLDESFICGAMSIADLALFPHVSALKLLGFDLTPLPKLAAWFSRMRAVPCVKRDLDHLKAQAAAAFSQPTHAYEATRIVWRGDRIEWLFAHGHLDWFVAEWRAGRVIIPGAPAP